jgi:hypothetical protein
MLELFTLDTGRTMQPGPLAEELMEFFPEVKVKQVAYHLVVLRDARLIPWS